MRLAVVMGIALTLSGCMFSKKKPAPVVVPVAPVAAPAPTPDPPKPTPAAVKPVVRPVKPAVVTPAPAPTAAPKLGELLTPAQQAEMNRTVDQSTALARAALARVRTRKLTAEQAESAERIRTFAAQAEQARKTDLRAAAQLARRAEVLARDLEASLK